MSGAWPEPFISAKEALDPVIRAAHYRFVGMDRWGTDDRGASAEYRGKGRRLRLLFEAETGAGSLWIDTALEQGAEIVSRWTDIEWLLAGERMVQNFDISEDRIDQLVTATARFLVANDLPPIPDGTPPDRG